MKLRVENFQKIKEANIDLNTITLIAGGNDSGKSTLSKILYSIIKANSTHVEDFLLNLKNHIKNDLSEEFAKFLFDSNCSIKTLERIFNIKYVPRFSDFSFNKYYLDSYIMSEDLKEKQSNSKFSQILDYSFLILKEYFIDILDLDIPNLLLQNLNKFNDYIDEIKFNCFNDSSQNLSFYQSLNLFKSYMNVFLSYDVETMIQPSLNKYFRSEFNRTERVSLEKYNIPTISLSDYPGFSIDISLKNRLILNDYYNHYFFINDAIYIESPYLMLLENINYYNLNLPLHISDLMVKLKSEPNANEKFKSDLDQLFFSSMYDELSRKISSIINAKISYDSESGKFKMLRNKSSYPMVNTASGIKALGIILRLVDNLTITENTLLIFDEPEVNLHPDWQVKLTEIIVLISQYYKNIKIFINTHSPYIVQGIKYFSSKNLFDEYVSYYLAEEISNDERNIIFKNVSDDPSPIFSKLSSPLENIVWGV